MELKDELLESVINSSRAKHKLGLLGYEVTAEDIEKIEILFLFADYNPKSMALRTEIKRIEKSIPARRLFLKKEEHTIHYNEGKDLFAD